MQLCLLCGVRGDVDLCPRDADGDAANDGVCGDVVSCPEDAADGGDGDRFGSSCRGADDAVLCAAYAVVPHSCVPDGVCDTGSCVCFAACAATWTCARAMPTATPPTTVCGDVDSSPADTENDADGDCTRGGGVCATAVVSYPYDRMIMPITTPCAATRVPRSSRTCCWRASRHGSCRISSAFGLSGTVGGESHLKSTSQQRWRVRRSRLGPRERRRRRPSGDDDDDDDRARPCTLCIYVDHDNTATSVSMTSR